MLRSLTMVKAILLEMKHGLIPLQTNVLAEMSTNKAKHKRLKGENMSFKIKIKNARLSFPSVFKKANFNGQEGKYEATFLFPKSDTKTYKAIMDGIEAIKKENKNVKVASDKLCIKDGDEIEYDGYQNMWAVKASNSARPTVVNRDRTPIVEEDGVIYAGCYVNAVIELWFQNNSYGKRINSNLLGIQFVKDGEPFGTEKVASADDFDEIDDDEEF